MTITPTEAEMIADAIESAAIDLHTALPGSVQSYDAAAQTATIVLGVDRVLPKADGSFVSEALPPLENVPVAFMRAGGMILSMPLAEGDTGLVVFSEMSIDQWRSKGTTSNPGDIGRHTLSGGVFYPGLSPVTKPIVADLSGDAVFGSDDASGVAIRVKGATVEIVTGDNLASDDFVAMAGLVHSTISDMLAAGAANPALGAANFAAAKVVWDLIFVLPLTGVASANLKADNP